MSLGLLLANVDRAVDHGVVLIAVVVIAAIAGLIYGLRRVVAKSRAGRTCSDEGRSDRGPVA